MLYQTMAPSPVIQYFEQNRRNITDEKDSGCLMGGYWPLSLPWASEIEPPKQLSIKFYSCCLVGWCGWML